MHLGTLEAIFRTQYQTPKSLVDKARAYPSSKILWKFLFPVLERFRTNFPLGCPSQLRLALYKVCDKRRSQIDNTVTKVIWHALTYHILVLRRCR